MSIKNTTIILPEHQKGLLNDVFILLMGTFIIGLSFVDRFQLMSQVIRYAGIGLIVLYILTFNPIKMKIAPEVVLFGFFILWAMLSGAIVAKEKTLFWDQIKTLIQLWTLVFAITGFAMVRGSIKENLIMFVVCVFFLDLSELVTSDYRLVIDPLSRIRISSYLWNSNNFGLYNQLGIFSLLFMFNKIRKRVFKFLWVIFFILFTSAIINSGSQKSFIGLLILLIGWGWFCIRKLIIIKRSYYKYLLLGMVALLLLIFNVYQVTYLGVRIQNTLAGKDSSFFERQTLYTRGIHVFLENPLTGIGVSNIFANSSLVYTSHSDYIEILSTTGFIGFLLYIAIYIVTWNRINKIRNLSKSQQINYDMGLIKAFILLILFLGFSKLNYISITTWFIFSSLIGYSISIHEIQIKNPENTGIRKKEHYNKFLRYN